MRPGVHGIALGGEWRERNAGREQPFRGALSGGENPHPKQNHLGWGTGTLSFGTPRKQLARATRLVMGGYFSGHFASAMAWLCPKHPRIVAERLQVAHHNSLVIAMRGIDQIIVLIGGENRGHQQQTMLAVLCKFISDRKSTRL